MNDFKDMPAIDRRKFLAGFLATAASAGLLGRLGIKEDALLSDVIRDVDPGYMYAKSYHLNEIVKWH